jgi:hypothetical protein
MFDSALPHFLLAARLFLNNVFPAQCIGHGRPFPDLNLILISRTSKVYFLCCRSQWRQAQATTNTECTSDHSHDKRNFPPSRTFTHCSPVQLPSWSSVWTLWAFFFNRPEVLTRKPFFRIPVLIKHFFLYCGVDSPSAGSAVHFVFILYMDETKIAIGSIQSLTVNTDHKLW